MASKSVSIASGPTSPLKPFEECRVASFREMPFASEEMQKLLSMNVPDYVEKKRPPLKYDVNELMPDWILNNPQWKNAKLDSSDNNMISDILQIPFSSRSQEQSTILAKWLMSVWEIANTMGFKRVVNMSEVMHYSVYEPGRYIVKEGERGSSFYIIVSGTTDIRKEVNNFYSC